MDDLTGRQFGPYTIIGPLGEGGMASVYKAHQPAVNRDVALKILGRHFMQDPEFITRFKHEAWVVAQFQHPHILPVFDFGESDGLTYLVMPFIKGGQLSDLMTGTPMRLEMVDRIIRQICDALDYAHSKGVIHRDIKPTNILVDERLNCLVSDFGIARMTEGTTKLTATGAVVGTPTYMSPEQAAGETVGPQSDLYSLGIMLYEMVAGRVPFKAETPFAIALKHLSAPMPPPATFNPRLGPAIEAVVLKAVARSPRDRYASGEEFANALSGAIRKTQAIQEQKTIVEPRPESQTATDRAASTAAVPPLSATAQTVAVAPKTVPMPPKTAPMPPQTAPVAPTKTVAAAPPTAAADGRPSRSSLWAAVAIGIPLVAIVGYLGFGGSLQSPPLHRSTPPRIQAPVERAKPLVERPKRTAAPPPAAEPPAPQPAAAQPAPSPPATPQEPTPPADVTEPPARGQAIAILQRCNEGRGQACLNLARMFEAGRGVAQDDARALHFMRKACEFGEERACAALRTRFGRRGR
ncbi:MAG TPA: protein kinase [Vicinamibacterales bacterium]|nr:protein kinase [Vicinamibacterales bacterium]